MAEGTATERRVFWDQSDIPTGTKALIINVRDPFLTLATAESPDEEYPLFDQRLAYVEITQDEWASVKDDPPKADALALQFGDLVQRAMGASRHRWHLAENQSSPD